jgi:Zn-dependent protease
VLQGVDLTQVLIILVVLIASLSVHEAAHAFAADRLGDPTARHLGRLSLNPVVHVDPHECAADWLGQTGAGRHQAPQTSQA